MKIIQTKNNLKIETTLNVQASIKNSIILAAHRSGTSCTEIILRAMNCMMKEIDRGARIGTRLKYQKRREPGEWDCIHVMLRPEDYELFLDMRKFMKMSVSYIVARAIKKFLNSIVQKNTTDNNRLSGYTVIYEKLYDIRCWRIYWGRPTDIKPFPLHSLLL
jgi:hypothetical protein